MRKTVLSILLISFLISLVSCSSSSYTPTPAPKPEPPTINLALTSEAYSNRFVNLDYGIRLNIRDERASHKQTILYKHDNYLTSKPVVNVYPDVRSFVSESMRRYMRTMGFNLDSDISTDYMLNVSIKEYNVSYLSGIGWSGTVSMTISINDNNNQLVYPNVEIVGRATRQSSGSNYSVATEVINSAYANALEDIDWDRIAYFLKRADSPAQEKNKQVTGDGSTSLEHTILNWEVTSRPAGADVYWRVISSTPDVKNTNKNYKSTTPYESTESFDIKGLTYNNSGDVQIEILCEKPGYLPQKKVFNVRAAIDQKSINAHFTLVKDE
ncbi:MAG: hypothetical protein E7067_01375 [Lentimicrobiaceae bacterium]|nr:hypothetical protein [Lentimicrobiaceae bacterium]